MGLNTPWLAVKRNSLIRVTRRAVSRGQLEAVQRMRCRGLPFEITVSRLLSSPSEPAFHLSLTLLNPLSDLDIYLALGGGYPPYSYYTLKQYYYASSFQGATRVALCGLADSTALCARGEARLQFWIQAWLFPFRSPLLGESHFDFCSWAY